MKAKNRLLLLLLSIASVLYFIPSLTPKTERVYIPTVIVDSFEEKSEYNPVEIETPPNSDQIDEIYLGNQSSNSLLVRRKCSESTLINEFKDFTASKVTFWSSIRGKISTFSEEWKSHLSGVTNTLDYVPSSRGIIIACSPSLLKSTLKLIKVLVSLKCALPIEIYHNSELKPEDIKSLESFSRVVVHSLKVRKNFKLDGGKLFQIKIESMIQSRLDEILFLDSDNFPLRDPEILFEMKEFVNTGAVFWRDYWKTVPTNPIWDILGIECIDEFEQESGQILIKKSFKGIFRALEMTRYMQDHSDLYFKLFLGDKDSFRFGFRASNQSFHMVNVDVRPVGSDSIPFKGHSMVQSLPDGTPMFVHANLLKYHDIKKFEGKKIFAKIQSGGVAVYKDTSIYLDGGETQDFLTDIDVDFFYKT